MHSRAQRRVRPLYGSPTILPEVAPTLLRMPHPAIFGPTALLADGLRPSADNPLCEMAPPAKGRHPAGLGHRFRIFPNLNSAGMDSSPTLATVTEYAAAFQPETYPSLRAKTTSRDSVGRFSATPVATPGIYLRIATETAMCGISTLANTATIYPQVR